QHVVVVFHESRRAPGTGEDVEFSARGSQRLFDKWYSILPIVADAERLQTLVALSYVGVAAAREITTMNICPRQLVPNAALFVEVGIQKLLLLFLRQHCKRLSRSIGQSSANSQEGLELLAGIDKYADLRFPGLADSFEIQLVSHRNSVISFV